MFGEEMNVIFYALSFGVLVAGLLRGTAYPATRSIGAVVVSALFWISLVGLASLTTNLIAIFGIAAVFDERSSGSPNGFDRLFAISWQMALVCTVLAIVAHAAAFSRSTKRATNHTVTSAGANPAPPRSSA